MSIHSIGLALALGAAVLIPIAASAATPAAQHCILAGHRVTSVKPYQVVERQGRGSSTRRAGAEVFVQAGAGFAVKIIASSPSQAKEVLRRAELLQH